MFYVSLQQSGKLVMKMFQKIQELIDDKDALVCVLIDEVFWTLVISIVFYYYCSIMPVMFEKLKDSFYIPS